MTAMEDFLRLAQRNVRPLRAPYSFATLNEKVLPSPVADTLDLSRPVQHAYGGTLKVTWNVETPILVGGSDDTIDSPLHIDGAYRLPGSSLRGMIRSVMEIASFSRLAFYDGEFVGATRNMTGVTWSKTVSPSKEDRPVGGWLFKYRLNNKWAFRIVYSGQGKDNRDTRKIKIDRLLELFGSCGTIIDKSVWDDSTLHARLKIIDEAGLSGMQPLSRFSGDPDSDGQSMLVVASTTPLEAREGPKKKVREHLFVWPDGEPGGEPVLTDVASKFLDSLHRDSNARIADSEQPPEANFDALTASGRIDGFGCGQTPLAEQLTKPERFGLPVFVRDKSRKILSLTAFTRLPFDKRLHEIAEISQPKNDIGEKLDFTQALMGWAAAEVKERKPHARLTQETALRSRVMFGFATADDGKLRPRERMIAMKPRPSFFPYYLTPADESAKHPIDYDNPKARLRGRKRYPAGPAPTNITVGPQPAPPTDPGSLESDITFLEASPENPLTFTSNIHIRNLTEIELGGLVWCITLGQHGRSDRGFRHMLGRAKAFGRGQIRSKIEVEATTVSSALSGTSADLEAALQAFTKWVEDALHEETPFEELSPIEDLLSIAHAPTGTELRSAKPNALDFPRDSNPREGRDDILEAYSKIKKYVDDTPTAQRSGVGEKKVSFDPENDAFVGLPRYPKQW